MVRRLLPLVLLVPLLAGCAALQEVANLRHLDFGIDGVRGATLAGVDLSGVRSYDDLGALEGARIAAALTRGEAPLAFTLLVGAENPAENAVQARLVKLDWTLLLDGTETVSGVFNEERLIPPGERAELPIALELDLVRFFGRNARDLVDLALALSGEGHAEVALRARPSVTTPLGPIAYPGELTIVRHTVGR